MTQVTLALAFIGGFVRLASALAIGWPHPVFAATLALELVVVPVVFLWHARAVQRAERAAPGITDKTGTAAA